MTATQVVLTYLVPVYVVVDDCGDGLGPVVAAVHVDDECSFDSGNRKVARNDSGQILPMGDPAVLEAIALVETGDSDWPSWDFGW